MELVLRVESRDSASSPSASSYTSSSLVIIPLLRHLVLSTLSMISREDTSMDNIQSVTMSRVGGAMAASRTFDITFTMKNGMAEHQFSNINRYVVVLCTLRVSEANT